MIRIQRLVLVLAGVLIAARLFVPVTECTLTNPFTRLSYSYQLPRFIAWNYEHYYPAGKGVTLRQPSDWASVFDFNDGRWHESHGGGPDTIGLMNPLSLFPPYPVPTTEFGTQAKPDIQDVPEGSRAYWNKELNMWDVTFPRPSLLKRIVTLDPGGYWLTSCPPGWEQRVLPSLTLLHALGIAVLAGVALLLPAPAIPRIPLTSRAKEILGFVVVLVLWIAFWGTLLGWVGSWAQGLWPLFLLLLLGRWWMSRRSRERV